MLAVSGQLNPQLGGPSYQDFRPFIYKTVQYYEPLDPVGPEFNRRSIYRFWARGGKNPLLDTFDCPDPSTAAPKRRATTTPLQALALLNNSFTLRMADHLAERLEREAAGKIASSKSSGPLQLAYGRTAIGRRADRVDAFVEAARPARVLPRAAQHQRFPLRELTHVCPHSAIRNPQSAIAPARLSLLGRQRPRRNRSCSACLGREACVPPAFRARPRTRRRTCRPRPGGRFTSAAAAASASSTRSTTSRSWPGATASRWAATRSRTSFFGQIGLLRQNDWAFQQRGQSGLWISELFPHLARRGRRADRHPLDGRRLGQPHAGHVAGELRLPAQRLSDARLVAVVRPGLRDRRAAGVCRPARSPRPARRRHEQLDQRLSARPASGRDVRHASGPRPIRRSVPRPPDRRRRRSRQPRAAPPPQRAAPGSKSAKAASWPRGCRPTSWPPRCSSPCRG